MNRFFRSLCGVALMLFVSVSANALNPLPVDNEVVIGKLDNGLTYYIRHNERPAGCVDFYLAQSVGSVNEEENQRGLAHFLEHLCFNGTENFPGNSLIDYLESIGVKFGANLNAYTSTDRTVYNICEVPVAAGEAVDSCLIILRDWSGRLLLRDEDIDAERGVIKSEWRQKGAQPSSRLVEKAAVEIYPDSRYGNRMPIGLMSVVENFHPDELRDYYHKWYHPQNQCVIVVGDIDPALIESKIRQLWSDYSLHENATKSTPLQVADNDRVIATMQTDPEQGNTLVQLYLKHQPVDPTLENTIAELRRDVYGSLVAEMLAERFDGVENSPAAPFSNLGIGDRHFLLASHQPALQIRCTTGINGAPEAVAAVATELKRASTYGFTQTELDRAKLSALSDADSRFASSKSTTNTVYAKRYVEHFLEGGILPSEEQLYKMSKGVISNVTLSDVNDYLCSIVDEGGRNVVIIGYGPSANTTTTSADLVAAYESIDTASLTPYVDNFNHRELPEPSRPAGKIVSEEVNPLFGSTVWTLSNGIKVNIKPIDFESNKVIIAGKSPGGLSKVYNEADVATFIAINDLLALSKVGDMSTTELKKVLAGNSARSSVAVGKMEETLSASANSSDVETAFKLIYLRATDLRCDSTAFNTFIANAEIKARSQASNATFAMGDSIHANVFDHHPLATEHLHDAEIPNINYDRALQVWSDRFGDMSDFTFYITGNFEPDSLRPLVEKYIAALPCNGRFETPSDIGYHYTSSSDRRRFTSQMENPQAITYCFYSSPCDYNLDNVIKANILGQIVQSRLREDLREQRGLTYGIKGHCSVSAGMNGDDPANLIMPVYIRVAPEDAETVFETVVATVNSLADSDSITADELQKCREYMLKNYADNSTDASYWITVMRMYDKFGQDMHTEFPALLNSLQPADISAFCRHHLAPRLPLRLSMLPE